MDSQQNQQQQKKNQEGYASSQAYDQPHYNNYHHTQQKNPYHQHPSYQNSAQQGISHQPSSAPAVGVSASPQMTEHGDGLLGSGPKQVQGQQNGYYQFGVGVGGDGNQSGMIANGMNPVMAAAAMMLAQFAGTMGQGVSQGQLWNHGVRGGFEPVMGGPGMVAGPSSMMGHGQAHSRAGTMRPTARGGPSQGTAHGNSSRRPFGRGRSGSFFRGRGYDRGRGGPRHGRTRGTFSSPEPRPPTGELGPSADRGEEETKAQVLPQTTAPAQINTTTKQASSPAAWCDLCRVECTSLEIFDQHKNGKRHQKNLQKVEKSQIDNETATSMDNAQTPARSSTNETLKPGNLMQGNENKQHPAENLNPEALSKEAKELDDSAVQQENDHAKVPLMNSASNQKQGVKRKTQKDREGKRIKQEPRVPKVVIPLICDLCNVKCDTQGQFDGHLSGKKHIAKLKRYQGHQATYGSIGLQALYPPNPISQTLVNQGSQHGLHLQHISHPPQGPYVPPETNPYAIVAVDAAVGTVPSVQENLDIEMSNANML